MTWFAVDVEADGPCPGLYSMISFGAVRVDRDLKTTFYGRTAPLNGADFDLKALAVSYTSRQDHIAYPHAAIAMRDFRKWLVENSEGEIKLVSDNPAFDWQWIHHYFHLFCGDNPMGHSARRIGDMYAGFVRDANKGHGWKKLRTTKHTHYPVDDAMGVAEALVAMADQGFVVPGL